MDFKNFSKTCHSLALEINGKILSLTKSGITPNFHSCNLLINFDNIYILCSNNNDWAFTKNFALNNQTINFCDQNNISQYLKSMHNIIPLTQIELNGPFKLRDYLDENDIKHWKPKTLGEGLFNWWD
jgi:hypothetical protein